MDRLKSLSVSDLIWALRRNYPSGPTTFGECLSCKRSARAGGFCTSCLVAEGDRRGVSLHRLEAWLREQMTAMFEVEREIERINDLVLAESK